MPDPTPGDLASLLRSGPDLTFSADTVERDRFAAQVEALEADRDRLAAILAAVDALHIPTPELVLAHPDGVIRDRCSCGWWADGYLRRAEDPPRYCPTRAALDGTGSAAARAVSTLREVYATLEAPCSCPPAADCTHGTAVSRAQVWHARDLIRTALPEVDRRG